MVDNTNSNTNAVEPILDSTSSINEPVSDSSDNMSLDSPNASITDDCKQPETYSIPVNQNLAPVGTPQATTPQVIAPQVTEIHVHTAPAAVEEDDLTASFIKAIFTNKVTRVIAIILLVLVFLAFTLYHFLPSDIKNDVSSSFSKLTGYELKSFSSDDEPLVSALPTASVAPTSASVALPADNNATLDPVTPDEDIIEPSSNPISVTTLNGIDFSKYAAKLSYSTFTLCNKQFSLPCKFSEFKVDGYNDWYLGYNPVSHIAFNENDIVDSKRYNNLSSVYNDTNCVLALITADRDSSKDVTYNDTMVSAVKMTSGIEKKGEKATRAANVTFAGGITWEQTKDEIIDILGYAKNNKKEPGYTTMIYSQTTNDNIQAANGLHNPLVIEVELNLHVDDNLGLTSVIINYNINYQKVN